MCGIGVSGNAGVGADAVRFPVADAQLSPGTYMRGSASASLPRSPAIKQACSAGWGLP